jgi:hypothetical protein
MKMSKHSFVEIMSENKCKEYVSIIDSLSDHWTKRIIGQFHFYTLGSASHLDLEKNMVVDDSTFIKIKENNNLLRKNFLPIYSKLIEAISDKVGSGILISDNAPIPGFFIYGEPKPNNIKKELSAIVGGRAEIHTDGQVNNLDYIWSQYKEVADECISYTLPLEMPENGAGFLLWDQPDMGCYSQGEVADTYKSYDYHQDDKNINFLTNSIKNKIPEFIEHIPGRMLLQEGEQFHAVAFSTKPFSTDRRITFQGLGIKCDGVWRLFF